MNNMYIEGLENDYLHLPLIVETVMVLLVMLGRYGCSSGQAYP